MDLLITLNFGINVLILKNKPKVLVICFHKSVNTLNTRVRQDRDWYLLCFSPQFKKSKLGQCLSCPSFNAASYIWKYTFLGSFPLEAVFRLFCKMFCDYSFLNVFRFQFV